MDKLKWCTSVLCTTFPFQRRLKAGHAANLIQSGQNHIELQHLGMWSEKYWPYIFEFLLWVASARCTEALFQAFNPGWSPSEDVWKNTSWLRAQKKCVLSAAASAKSTHHSNRCRQGAGQCSIGIMEKQVVDAFNKPIHHRQSWRRPDIWFQKPSPVKPGCVFMQDPWKWCIIYFIRSPMQLQKHQIPVAFCHVLHNTVSSPLDPSALQPSNLLDHLYPQCCSGKSAFGGLVFGSYRLE